MDSSDKPKSTATVASRETPIRERQEGLSITDEKQTRTTGVVGKCAEARVSGRATLDDLPLGMEVS